ncbi:complement factor H-related protein 1-like isoform X5 [Lampris incognitus]|uniref:complement factor H-related protein 1-like isoform X5 n=1 Tax=Lampris incognitus TaxID=2546036 RepID=UPI0024B48C6E|nr:complement factor H-related protein 1-like isoform X5 [Lampris incognitus]
MFLRYLGLVLLLPFPKAVNAQGGTGPCNPPTLKGGYFYPQQVSYRHGSQITYACDEGRKPVVEGWWATIKCQNGEWSHEPQCIDVPVHPHSRDETRPMIIPVVNCGQIPTISYGVVKRQRMFLEYQCDNFHKLVREPRVTC